MTGPFELATDVQHDAWQRAAEMVEKGGMATERLETLGSVDVGTTPSEVVYEENKLQLLHYESETETQHDVPILIVYALINRPYILDLQPDRSVVRTLLENGFDVYLIDWDEPSALDRALTLDDYVTRYIDNCVDVVCDRSSQDAINILGYCMGGTMSVMYASLFPEKVRNLGLMAAGLCFDGTGGVLERWGGADHFEPSEVTETFGNVPAGFLDVGFALMDPVANNITKYVRFLDNMDDEEFVENFARMERWLADGIDVAGAAYEQFIRDVYQENKLYRNELTLNGKSVDLENIDMPVLNIIAEYDHLIPPDASRPFNEVVASDDTTLMEFPTGHIGMSVSSRSHDELWPDVCRWFEARSNGETEVVTDPAREPEAEVPDAARTQDVAGDETGPEDGAPARADPASNGGAHVEHGSAEPDDLTELTGIGQAYADDLREAGIERFDQLAAADPDELSDRTGISQSRIEDWIDQAADH